MSMTAKPLRVSIDWLDEPELAFADQLTHIDPKIGIPAAGPWSRDQPNHPASVTAGFIGTGECIAKARNWLRRAAEGVDGDADHHRSAVTSRQGRSRRNCESTAPRPRSLRANFAISQPIVSRRLTASTIC